MFKQLAVVILMGAGLAGCAQSSWETAYTQLDPTQTANWRVSSVDVQAPETLTTSEENTYTPNYDVVWHGEPYGDRRAQAAAIVKEGIRRGSAGVHGRQSVKLVAVIQQFHALSPITRASNFTNAGVHDVRYTLQAFDARTGAPLTEPQLIKADLVGYTGKQGNEADARGETQKVRITRHIAAVTNNWLGYEPDPRGGFSRLGR